MARLAGYYAEIIEEYYQQEAIAYGDRRYVRELEKQWMWMVKISWKTTVCRRKFSMN
jgi:uncharacterized protein YmfQ (DUF2313 family)